MGSLIAILISIFFVHASEVPVLRVVDSFEPSLYVGIWYEVASTRGLITRECVCTRAHYELLENGNLSVYNTCNRFAPRGPLIQSKSVMKEFSSKTTGLISKHYRVIEIGSNYEYAVISDATGRGVFILSRDFEIDTDLYTEILLRLWSQGIDADLMSPTRHHDCNYPK